MCDTSTQNNPELTERRAAVPRSFLARTRATGAQVLRMVSGVTAGVRAPAKNSRRGSFLVLVVGVLALLSVIAVLYATLGSGDRQRTNAVVRKNVLDDYPTRVGDYLAGIIAADGLSSIFESLPNPSGTSGNPVAREDGTFTRESFDYPFTNWQATSQFALSNPLQPLFTPTGEPRFSIDGEVAGQTPGFPTHWIPSDPYLASNEPVFLDFQVGGTTIDKYYTVRRDWLHITNASPDGRFVNLAALRGNFDSTSRNLTVGLSIPGADPYNAPGGSTDFNIPLDQQTPAHFDSRQVGAFRPMFDGRVPSDYNHIHNQWADADGDGFADSRWFELVDAALPFGQESSIIPRDPSLRYFVAARIIDLSGLVNVNTASDQMSPPAITRPIGSSPGEVDLRTLLTLDWQADLGHLPPLNATGGLYDGLFLDPRDPATSLQNYVAYSDPREIGHYAYESILLSRASGNTVPPEDTFFTSADGSDVPGYFGPGLGDNIDGSFASRYSIVSAETRQVWDFDISVVPAPNLLAPAEARFRAYAIRRGTSRGAYLDRATTTATPSVPGDMGTRGIFAQEDALELFKYHGANDAETTSPLEVVTGGRHSNPGQFQQCGPLRDNRFLHNERPERVLEAVVSTNDDQWDRARLHKMVDVRQRLTPFSWAREMRLVTGVNPDRVSEFESRINPVPLLGASGTFMSSIPVNDPNGNTPNNVRRVDVAFNMLFKGYFEALVPYASEGNGVAANHAWGNGVAVQAARGATLSYGAQGAEFGLLTSAFLAVNLQDKFDLDSTPQARTVLIDNNARQVLNDDGLITQDTFVPGSVQLFPWWHSNSGDADLHNGDPREPIQFQQDGDLDSMKLAAFDWRGDAINARAVNVFGVEPQVFVTGTTSFTVYTDAPDSVPGSSPENGTGEITIKGNILENNADLVMRVVAFQLTNPFNVDVRLGCDEFTTFNATDNPAGKNLHWLDVGDPSFPGFTRLKDYFYIEFGGKQYALARLEEQRDRDNPAEVRGPNKSGNTGHYTDLSAGDGVDIIAKPIIVPAGESVVVYAVNRIPRKILANMTALDATHMNAPINDISVGGVQVPRNQSSHEFKKLIRKHIADKGLGIGRPNTVSTPNDGVYDQDGIYWIPEIYSPPEPVAADEDRLGKPGMSTGAVTASTFVTFDESVTSTNGIFGNVITGLGSAPQNQIVKLWRSMRAGIDEPTNNPNAPLRTGEQVREQVRLPARAWDNSTANPFPRTEMYTHNDRRNDLLVDRLRLPLQANFDTTLGVGQSQPRPILNTTSDPLDPANDDTGYTITLWDSVHRPADPDGDNDIRSGSLPAYCMERKLRADAGDPTLSWNIRVQDAFREPLRRSDFIAGSLKAGADVEFDQWFNDPTSHGGGSGNLLIDAVGRAPSRRGPNATNAVFTTSRINIAPGTGVEKPDFREDRPELIVNNARYGLPNAAIATLAPNTPRTMEFFSSLFGKELDRSYLRTIDMLSPLAVGTVHDPLAPVPANWAGIGLTAEDIQWTPLSETFCLALGYETAPIPDVDPSDPRCAIRTLFPQRRVDPTNANSLFKRLYDHAQLKLDDYVPFVDDNTDGTLTLNPTNPLASEFRRGAETPLAWNVLDTFSIRASNLNAVTQGAININTASRTVLSTIPMFAPPIIGDDPLLVHNPANPVRPGWWWNVNPPGPNVPTGITTATDVTAMVELSRDKAPVYFRPGSEPAGYVGIIMPTGNPFDGVGYDNISDRQDSTNIPDISEMPGFRTPGAILMARWRDGSPNAAAFPMNIDHLGFDRNGSLPANSSYLGVTSDLTKNWDNTTNSWFITPNLAGNDYQEKIAIVGAALGSTTNRSDVFAVWFVVQGYSREDVEGSTATTNPETATVPMVPSVKRRFVMVVDRSNVRQKGDKPKILLMKEVPVE